MIVCVEHCITGRIKLIDTTVKYWETAFDMDDFPIKNTEVTLIRMCIHFNGKTVQNGELIAYKYSLEHLTGKQQKAKKK